jgi:hypothetical protein
MIWVVSVIGAGIIVVLIVAGAALLGLSRNDRQEP